MPVQFKCIIKKFDQQGEKTGWTYIEIPSHTVQLLKPGNKKTFRVLGKIDQVKFKGTALLPMGDGSFIMALNAGFRKKLNKRPGAMCMAELSVDASPVEINHELLECLEDEPAANTFFKTLTKGHQKYFSNWINAAKTTETKSKRIAEAVMALSVKKGYGEMIRALTLSRKQKLS